MTRLVGTFDSIDDVLLNATANTATATYHTHGECQFVGRMNAAKVVARSTVAWHDVDECSRCRHLRDRDGISEREAVVRTIRGDLPVLDDDAETYATVARADEIIDGDIDLAPEVTL